MNTLPANAPRPAPQGGLQCGNVVEGTLTRVEFSTRNSWALVEFREPSADPLALGRIREGFLAAPAQMLDGFRVGTRIAGLIVQEIPVHPDFGGPRLRFVDDVDEPSSPEWTGHESDDREEEPS